MTDKYEWQQVKETNTVRFLKIVTNKVVCVLEIIWRMWQKSCHKDLGCDWNVSSMANLVREAKCGGSHIYFISFMRHANQFILTTTLSQSKEMVQCLLQDCWKDSILTLKAADSAVAPSFSSLFLPEMKTRSDRGCPSATLLLWHSSKHSANICNWKNKSFSVILKNWATAHTNPKKLAIATLTTHFLFRNCLLTFSVPQYT